jgi:hypothetical protein
MLKPAKRAVAVAVVIAAARAPVAAHADTLPLSHTHLAVTYTVQDDHAQAAVQPR